MLFKFQKFKQNRIKIKKGMGSKENVALRGFTHKTSVQKKLLAERGGGGGVWNFRSACKLKIQGFPVFIQY